MNVAVPRVLKSWFFVWIMVAVASSYFLFSFDKEILLNSSGNIFERIANAFTMPRINLGIDLKGGTRLVLRVDVDKSAEVRLLDMARDIDRYLRRARISIPTKKGIVEGVLKLSFSDVTNSKNAFEKILEGFSPTEIEVKLKDSDVLVNLVAGYRDKIKTNSIEQAVNILRTRLDTIDVKGLSVSKHGSHNVVVMLPGMSNADIIDIKQAIARSARLEFKVVEAHSSTKGKLLERFGGVLPPDKMILAGKGDEESGGGWYLVSIFSDVSGKNIATANVGYDDFGRAKIDFQMNSEGAREMRETTGRNIGRQLAVIMDGRVQSAPNIQTEIGKTGSITGSYSHDEAMKVAALLKSGSLDAPLIIEQENRVGASLGRDSIVCGLQSCLISLVLLLVFAIFYYTLAGFLAFIALVYNIIILLLFLSYFKATLTLPGIAGIVLTIGMAIDASILIYESIREALKDGMSYRDAVRVGFKDAMEVILDSNITTFIAGVVLFWWGGPAVRGFAVTLMLGIISTIISGVFFLRSMFDFILDNSSVEKISM